MPMYSSSPILTGSIMGATIAALDILLRPRLATSALQELFLFFIEGFGATVVYNMTGGCGSATGIYGNGNIIYQSGIAGVAVWITDLVLRPNFAANMQLLRFLLQGIILYYVISASKAMRMPSVVSE